MVEWVTIEAVTLYLIVIASFFLSLLAVVFVYRLSRITGLFGAWAFLIAGLAMTALEDFAYFGSVIFVSYSKVETSVEGYTLGTFLFEGLILVVIPAMFFGSMYQLHTIFKAQKSQSNANIAN